MTESSSAEAVPIEVGDSLPPEENTDFSEAPVFGPDKVDEFKSHDDDKNVFPFG
jgi:hypothetical protein